jgi:hypothetical protein
MLSRTLSLATVTLLAGCLAIGSAHAQVTNLEAGKSPSQIFAGTCNACHKSPRGLLKTVPASSLPSFLRQHYTTSSDMASVLASFLVSNGANDTRYQGKQDQAKQGKDAKQEPRPDTRQEARPAAPPDQLDRFGRRLRPPAATQEAARPDGDGATPQGEGARTGRNSKRQARPGDTPDAATTSDGQAGTDSKSGTRNRLSKRGKPGEELPKSDTAKPEVPTDEAAKGDAAKGDADKADAAKPASDGNSETAKADAPKEAVKEAVKETVKETAKENGGGEPTALRPDPVPPVTPAPATASSANTAAGTPEPAASPSVALPVQSASPVPSSVTTSAPPSLPVAPAGPPTPPISQ